MDVVIVGSGKAAQACSLALEAKGVHPRLRSRATGFDVLRDDASSNFGAFDVVVEVTGTGTTDKGKAVDFFTRSTSNIAHAAQRVGARHILLSIVNCTTPEVQGYGYYAGKKAQEETARAINGDTIIVRSTQWFEFGGQMADQLSKGVFAVVPNMLIQPLALDEVAKAIAECVTGDRRELEANLTGPEIMTLRSLIRQVRPNIKVMIPVPVPGGSAKAFRTGALLPSDSVEVLGPNLQEWLRNLRVQNV